MKVLNIFLLLLVMVFAQTLQAADIDNVKQQLINDIKQANARHNTSVESISQQRAKLLKILAIEEQKLEKLTNRRK